MQLAPKARHRIRQQAKAKGPFARGQTRPGSHKPTRLTLHLPDSIPTRIAARRYATVESHACHGNVHPHIRSHGSPVCWGSFAAPVSAAIEDRQFDAVLQLLMLHLTCFNTAHAFAQLCTFAPGGENCVEPPNSLVRGTQPKGC